MDEQQEIRSLLRKKYIRARESLSPADREAYSLRITERIVSLPEFREASVVMCYRAVRGEADLDRLPAHPAAAGKQFVYPRCNGPEEMDAMLPAGWAKGAFGIPEPADGSVTMAPERIGLVVCPGTAFDDRGARLGMGGGYYDRFLPKCVNAVRVMAAFEAQRAEQLPQRGTDAGMDIIVTEEKVRRIRRGEVSCD